MDQTSSEERTRKRHSSRHKDSAPPLRILHVISGLGPGGAETVLFRLITRSEKLGHEVICLGPREWFSDKLEQQGVPVHHVRLSSPLASVAAAFRLYRLIRSSGADLVQCWMYRGNVFGGLAARIAGKRVLWNLRCSDIHLYPLQTRMLARLGGILARWVPDKILSCSITSRQQHGAMGYDAVDGAVIPNGYDGTQFHPDERARRSTREALGIHKGTFIAGTIGRWDSQKDYPMLLRAVRFLRDRGVRFRLLLIGPGLDGSNADLARLIEESGCADIIHPLGYQADVADLARALDLHVLASRTEGFPNAVAETMLCGTPNVVTDAGDSRLIVGDTGWVVPTGNAELLAAAIERAQHEWEDAPDRWRERRNSARRRIVENFSLERMVETYQRIWMEIPAKDRLARAIESRGGRTGAFERKMGLTDRNKGTSPQALDRNLDSETVAGFGREWARFDQSRLVGEEYENLFELYFGLFPFADLPPNAEGFDLGCGSGRWAAGVAPRVGKLHCIDPSRDALDVARLRLAGATNISFHLAPANAMPLPDGSQDFGYSLGVLHHIPDPPSALAAAVRKLKAGAPFLLYIYYDLENRPAWFRAIWRCTDAFRQVICRLPFALKMIVTSLAAVTLYWPLARASKLVERLGFDPSNMPLSGYRNLSFYTMRTDALDRFGTRLEQRFSRQQIEQMMRGAGLTKIQFAEGAPYWIACGRRA